jgi:hypothetical protein
MLDRRKLIEANDANERGGKFKLAKNRGQKNEQVMQAQIPPPRAIFLSSNLPVES